MKPTKHIIIIFFLLISSVILLDACNTQSNKNNREITFNEHIAPIIHTNCTPCHRPGSAGPFSLITYEDVLRKAKTIVEVTQAGIMPPWPADPSYVTFAGEKILSEAEKKTYCRLGNFRCTKR